MRRIGFGRVPRLLLMTAIGVVATAGVAVATTLVTSAYTDPQGVYHGCVTASGLLRVVDPGDSCRAGETAIEWNKTGPKGDKGDTGDQGLQGPKGDTGDEGPPGPALAGSACTVGGASGTVQMSVASSGAISFTCVTSGGGGGGGGGDLCPNPLPSYPNATVTCDATTGAVLITACNYGYVDLNGIVTDGCEYGNGTPPTAETCNGLDDNLNGQVDEGFNVGASVPNGTVACSPDGTGTVVVCEAGWADTNGILSDGCEASTAALLWPPPLRRAPKTLQI